MSERVAFAFAERLGERVLRLDWADKLRAARLSQDEHKRLAPDIEKELAEFIGERGLSAGNSRFDWEGNSARRLPQKHSYVLLGTGAHPDAAVLSPFKCALEFDREHTKGFSHLKSALSKTACHVLSGAYEAAILVFTLERSASADAYIRDKSAHTEAYLQNLRASGVVLAIVPPQ